jgi:hypothetical protein
MNLARKMVLPRYARKSAFIGYLLLRLMFPSNKDLSPHPKRMPKYMPDRIASRNLKRWERIMGNDHPNLLASLPRLMPMTKNQRACWIPSLIGMELLSKVDFDPQNLKVLRTIFRGLYASGDTFAIEFNSHDSRILVLRIWHYSEKVMMEAELHDRLDGLIDSSNEQQIDLNLSLSMHTIDLRFVNSLIPMNQTGARIFYTRNVSLPLKQSSESFDRLFDLETYESVRFYKDTPEGQKPKKKCRIE